MILRNRRKPIHTFESLDGFLERLVVANYYQEVGWFLEHLKLSTRADPNLISSELILAKLSDLCRIDKERLLKMTIHNFIPYLLPGGEIKKLTLETWGEKEFPIWDQSVENNFYFKNSKKFCPLCAIEYRTSLLQWYLVPVTACPIHNVNLLEGCSSCGSRVDIQEGKCKNCSCKISQMQAPSIHSPEALFLNEMVSDALRLNNVALEPTLLKISRYSPIVSSPDYFSFLFKFGKILLGVDNNNIAFQYLPLIRPESKIPKYKLRLLPVASIQSILLAANNLLVNWPISFYESLDRIAVAEKELYNRTIGVRFHYTFPSRLRKAFPVEEWGWLWNEWMMYVKDIASKDAIPYLWLSYFKELTFQLTGERTGFFPITKAAREIGTHQKTLRGAAIKGEVIGIRNDKFPDRQFIIFEDQYVRQIREDVVSEMSKEEASKYLGVNRNIPQDLVESGLLKAEKQILGTHTRWQFKVKELDQFLNKITTSISLKHKIPDGECLDLVKAVKALYIPKFGIVDLLLRVIDGEVNACYDDTFPGLRGVWFVPNEIWGFRQKLLYPDGKIEFNIYEAMRFLKVSKLTILKMVEIGLLLPKNVKEADSVKWIFDISGVEAFDKRYIKVPEVALIIGRSSRTILSWVEQGILQPVSGNRFDGSYEYRFDRDYICDWRFNRLLSSEVMTLIGIKRRTLEEWVHKGKLVPIEEMGSHPLWFSKSQVLSLCNIPELKES